MDNTIKLNLKIHNESILKVRQLAEELAETLQKANSLLQELAFCELSFDIETQGD